MSESRLPGSQSTVSGSFIHEFIKVFSLCTVLYFLERDMEMKKKKKLSKKKSYHALFVTASCLLNFWKD